jgi:hypothetical protein
MQQPVFTIPSNQPLIGIPFEENGKEVTRYFSEQALVDRGEAAVKTEEVLHLAGSWSDLSWEKMEDALNCIRHESTATAPVEDL